MNVGDTFYRYEERYWAPPVDEFGNVCGSVSSTIVLVEFEVLKVTAKGVWIVRAPVRTLFGIIRFGADKRFVNLGARKRYALPTEAEALESFVARKERQASILESRAAQVRGLIAKAGHVKVALNFPRVPQNAAAAGQNDGVADGARTDARGTPGSTLRPPS
jgi:hypothetical protein